MLSSVLSKLALIAIGAMCLARTSEASTAYTLCQACEPRLCPQPKGEGKSLDCHEYAQSSHTCPKELKGKCNGKEKLCIDKIPQQYEVDFYQDPKNPEAAQAMYFQKTGHQEGILGQKLVIVEYKGHGDQHPKDNCSTEPKYTEQRIFITSDQEDAACLAVFDEPLSIVGVTVKDL